MIGLTTDEWGLLRDDFAEALLPDTATIRRRAGGSWGDVPGGPVPARLTVTSLLADTDGLSEAAATVGADAVVRFPVGTDVARGDRVTIDGRAAEVRMVVPAPRALLTVLVSLEGVA